MTLPDSWTNKHNSIPEYLEAIRQAEPPERFSIKFLENLGYTSTNDRKFIGILKSLGFLDADGKPTARYFEYLDLSRSEEVLATAIREAFSDLFAVNKEAHRLDTEEVKNKLKTLYAGSKKSTVIGYIANTFKALVDCADFDAAKPSIKPTDIEPEIGEVVAEEGKKRGGLPIVEGKGGRGSLSIGGLQYHVNIVLPESRDQAVYDAIFKALRDHLG